MLFLDQQVGKKGFDHPCLKSDCPKNQWKSYQLNHSLIFAADFFDDMKQFFYRITMIRVLPASPKNGVNHITTPVHLQGMEPLVLLVSRLNTMAIQGIIIFKHHRIDAEFNHSRTGLPEPPDKQPLQKLTKKIDSQKRKSAKKNRRVKFKNKKDRVPISQSKLFC